MKTWSDIKQQIKSLSDAEKTEITCDVCNTPSKHVIGLWDGANGTHGRLYDCYNVSCEIKRVRNKADRATKEDRDTIIATNKINMISTDFIKLQRKELQITISKMAKSLGISPSDYSNYEMCRVALPVEMVGRINDVFRGEMGN